MYNEMVKCSFQYCGWHDQNCYFRIFLSWSRVKDFQNTEKPTNESPMKWNVSVIATKRLQLFVGKRPKVAIDCQDFWAIIFNTLHKYFSLCRIFLLIFLTFVFRTKCNKQNVNYCWNSNKNGEKPKNILTRINNSEFLDNIFQNFRPYFTCFWVTF